MYRNFLFLLVCLMIKPLMAQELSAEVKVVAPKLQTTDPKIFKSLETDLKKYINTKVWTNEKYKANERIKCSFLFTITQEESSNTFRADVTVTATRPVYGSTYESTLLYTLDKGVRINYLPNEPINYVANVFTDRLSSLVAFYVYIILGLDGDSFAANGGNDYFLLAQNIINTIPGGISREGWKSDDGNINRYWLLENILSPRLRTMRTAWYSYHRQGLDLMHQNPDEGKRVLLRALETVDIAKRNYPQSQLIQSFMDAKTVELVEIFKKADKPQQQNVHNIMTRLDPSNASRFNSLLQ